jgi:hypothetical protein
MMKHQRLYINIDHVATLRQARRAAYPDPVAAARLCEDAGADGITAHLREDRRHIQDADVEALATGARTPFNLEMACTAEMAAIATRLAPHQVTLVPEKREEITTEGGLDLSADPLRVRDTVARLRVAGIRTSLFIDPDPRQVDLAAALAPTVMRRRTPARSTRCGRPHGAPRRPGSRSMPATASRSTTSALSRRSPRARSSTSGMRSSPMRSSWGWARRCARCGRRWTSRGMRRAVDRDAAVGHH